MKKFLLSLLCLISFMAINAETKTIDVTFSNYTAGTQYAINEAHVINESLTIYTTECHFTTQLRIYSSSTHNGYAVSNELPGAITQMTFNAGNKKDVLNVYGSTDGSSWELVEGISITSTSYNDYSLDFPANSSYTYFKLDVEGDQQIRIQNMSVTYTTSGGGEVVETVAKPTFSVASGVFTEPFDLTLSAEEGNTIYYTLDGSNPTVDSDIFDGEAIRISEYTEVKATAVNAQGVASSVATATYAFQNTANTAMTVTEALAWIEAGKDATTEQYVAGYITAIEEVSTQYGNATYSIADAIDGTDVLLVYRGNYLNGDKFTAEDQIKVGDKVLIYGKLKDYNGTPEVDSYSRIVSFLEKAPDEGGEEPGDDPVVPETPETATVVTFDFTAPSSLNPVQDTPEFGQQNSIIVNDVVFTAGNVSLSFDKGSASTDCRIWAGTSAYDLRTYSNSTMTFTVTGAAITSIVFTGNKASTTQMSVEDGTFEGKAWVGDSQSITFTTKATTNINTITVTYDTVTGIEDTMVDANAPVEYYNLQGVKVANPENGIFIKKQGAKATKVVL